MITDHEIALSCIELAAEKHRVPVKHVTGQVRKYKVCRARAAAIFDIWKNTGLTYENIGKYFNNLSPAGVFYAIKRSF